MNFEKAYKEMMKGKRIRRKVWDHFMHLRLVDQTVKTYNGEYTQFYEDAKILVSKGWLVVGGDGAELSFLEAIDELKNNKKITNKEWVEKGIDKFIFIDQNKFTACSAVEFKFMPSFMCLISNDWELMN